MKRKLKRRIKEPLLKLSPSITRAPSFTNLSLQLKLKITMEKKLKKNPKLDPKIRSEIPSSAASRVLFIEKNKK